MPFEQLADIFSYSDLYISAAILKADDCSCIEAFACGAIPIICDEKFTFSKQYALTDNNLFKQDDSNSLSKKIDYLFENPEALSSLSVKYQEYSKKFYPQNTIENLEKLFITGYNRVHIK